MFVRWVCGVVNKGLFAYVTRHLPTVSSKRYKSWTCKVSVQTGMNRGSSITYVEILWYWQGLFSQEAIDPRIRQYSHCHWMSPVKPETPCTNWKPPQSKYLKTLRKISRVTIHKTSCDRDCIVGNVSRICNYKRTDITYITNIGYWSHNECRFLVFVEESTWSSSF